MSVDGASRELIGDCLTRIAVGDPCAPFDLASAFTSHADAKDIGVTLAIVEALATIAKVQGCVESAEFLSKQWPDMKAVLRKRWLRAGFSG